MKEFNKMTVPQLRSALKERDLAQSGLKAELVSRLLSHSLQVFSFLSRERTIVVASNSKT